MTDKQIDEMSKALHADLKKATKQMLRGLTIEEQVVVAEIISLPNIIKAIKLKGS
jgi:hypothetical protein